DMSCLNFMSRCSTVSLVLFTPRVVRVRSSSERRKREPPQRFIRRRDDMPKPGQPGQPGQAPRPTGAAPA
ncbi:hypothetical protein H0E87_023732, partial [Populus deltoides]